MRVRRLLIALLAAGVLTACGTLSVPAPDGARAPFDHIVVLFMENRSFDHLFGTYPGADGIAGYKGRQADKSGVSYATLPHPLGRDGKPDPRFPGDLLDPPYPPQRVRTIMKRPSTDTTVGDRLGAKNVSWRWYAAGWGAGADAVAKGLMPHHNPFQYMQRVMESPDGRAHIEDGGEFVSALREGTLPSVAFVKPPASQNAHAVSSTVAAGDRFVADMVREVMTSRYWPRVVVVITYDEGGGWFDHVRPPVVDRFGLGTRVPALVVSPYARRGVVAHGQYEHASILKLIEWRFGLAPLTERDARAETFLEAFDFAQPPRVPIALP